MEEKRTPWIYRLIYRLVWLFSPKYRIEGAEHLPEGPCVIVGNHCQMYGPIAGEMYTPGEHAVWCVGEMMHREEVAAYAYRDFWSHKPRIVRPFFRLMSHLIVPLALLIFNNAHTIAVYHDNRLLATFRESVQKLQAGNRLVIFPECYTRHNNIVYAFQDKFVDVARFYCKRAGQPISFVPMYIAPALKTVFFGEPVPFCPEAPIAEEREQVCRKLADRITEIALAQPEHLVVPYPNMSRRHYKKNLPLEVYDDAETAG